MKETFAKLSIFAFFFVNGLAWSSRADVISKTPQQDKWIAQVVGSWILANGSKEDCAPYLSIERSDDNIEPYGDGVWLKRDNRYDSWGGPVRFNLSSKHESDFSEVQGNTQKTFVTKYYNPKDGYFYSLARVYQYPWHRMSKELVSSQQYSVKRLANDTLHLFSLDETRKSITKRNCYYVLKPTAFSMNKDVANPAQPSVIGSDGQKNVTSAPYAGLSENVTEQTVSGRQAN